MQKIRFVFCLLSIKEWLKSFPLANSSERANFVSEVEISKNIIGKTDNPMTSGSVIAARKVNVIEVKVQNVLCGSNLRYNYKRTKI